MVMTMEKLRTALKYTAKPTEEELLKDGLRCLDDALSNFTQMKNGEGKLAAHFIYSLIRFYEKKTQVSITDHID